MRTDEEIRARLAYARRGFDTARRHAASSYGPENRAAFAQLAAELSREVHAPEEEAQAVPTQASAVSLTSAARRRAFLPGPPCR